MKMIILLALFGSTLLIHENSINVEVDRFNKTIQDPDIKQEVLQILISKCNVCHRSRNPGKVFTLDNMDNLAPKIHHQVFVRKRMPKGKKIILNQIEHSI